MRVHWSHVSVDFEGQARMMEFFEHHPRVGDFMSTSFYSDARRHMDFQDGDKDAAFSSRCHNGPWRSWCAADLATAKFCSVTSGQSDPSHSRR